MTKHQKYVSSQTWCYEPIISTTPENEGGSEQSLDQAGQCSKTLDINLNQKVNNQTGFEIPYMSFITLIF